MVIGPDALAKMGPRLRGDRRESRDVLVNLIKMWSYTISPPQWPALVFVDTALSAPDKSRLRIVLLVG